MSMSSFWWDFRLGLEACRFTLACNCSESRKKFTKERGVKNVEVRIGSSSSLALSSLSRVFCRFLLTLAVSHWSRSIWWNVKILRSEVDSVC